MRGHTVLSLLVILDDVKVLYLMMHNVLIYRSVLGISPHLSINDVRNFSVNEIAS